MDRDMENYKDIRADEVRPGMEVVEIDGQQLKRYGYVRHVNDNTHIDLEPRKVTALVTITFENGHVMRCQPGDRVTIVEAGQPA